ncbi:adenylosuccinate synthetase [Gaetbulibacter sp. M240]|uniref:adenylosuccinate synthetase n=1 Tax=Gaetbulibacter sp. M240 TaxID=3126511 RepID=UPI00374E8082
MLNFLFQLPPGTRNPGDNTPIDFSNPIEVLVYIILPILIVVFYMLWRKKKKKEKE